MHGRTFINVIPTNKTSDSIDAGEMNEIDASYFKVKTKHVEIREAAGRYGKKCQSERNKRLEETLELEIEVREIDLMLAASKEEGSHVYSKEYLKEMNKKSKDLWKEIDRRTHYDSCMIQQIDELRRVSGVEVIQRHAVSVNFK